MFFSDFSLKKCFLVKNHVEDDRDDRAGDSDGRLEGNDLHAVADAHVDSAAGRVEEGSVRKGIKDSSSGVDHGCCREAGHAAGNKGGCEGLCRDGCAGCRGSCCRCHQDA